MARRQEKPSPAQPPAKGQPAPGTVWMAGLVGVVAILALLSVLVS